MSKQTNHKSTGIVLLIVGIVLLAIAALIQFGASSDKTSNESLSLYDATEENESCFINATYLSEIEPFATYDSYEDVGFYLVMDSEDSVFIVCMHKDDIAKYESLYTENMPTPIMMNGISKEFDSELQSYTTEYFNEIYGSEFINSSNFYDYLGSYYLYMGDDPDAALVNRYVIIAAILGFLLFFVGLLQIKKAKKNDMEMDAKMLSQDASSTAKEYTSPEIPVINHGAGIIGAILGALVGSIPWIIVGRMGYVSAWLGLLIIYAAIWGYQKLAGGITFSGKIVSGVAALVMVLVSEFVEYAWVMMDSMSYIMPGHATIFTTLTQLPTLLSSDADLKREFVGNLILGYAFVLIGLVYFLIQKKSQESFDKKEIRIFNPIKRTRNKRAVLVIPLVFGLLAGIMYSIRTNNYLIIFVVFILFFIIWVILLRKLNNTKISTNFKGFTYGDGQHQCLKLIQWENIKELKEPSSYEKNFQILMNDGSSHLIDGSAFDKFEEFLEILKKKTQLTNENGFLDNNTSGDIIQ